MSTTVTRFADDGILNKLRRLPLVLAISLLPLACVTSPEDEVSFPPSISEDTDYQVAYDDATSYYEIINNFETKFTVQTTLLSSKFRSAFAKRYQKLYNEEQPILNEASQRTAFFISIYTANEDLNNIGDANLWTIQLNKGQQTLRPTKIEKLRDKDRWRPFFTEITPWSREFLVLFDSPAPSSGDQDLVITKESRLVLSNQDGRVTITW